MLTTTLKRLGTVLFALAMVVAVLPSFASAAAPPRGMLFLHGDAVRTIALPASIPHGGRDPLYQVTNGTADQLGIAAVGPGDAGYHGGAWAVSTVTFNAGVTPYLLTSAEDVMAAEQSGDVTVTRMPSLDNRCPVLR
jgi:hypothetical protein